MLQKEDFRKLDELKSKLDSFRPLSSSIVKNLHEDLLIRWTYHSNAIEGNTLTLKETKVALEGITIGGKTLREHFEAINHKDAILFIEELAQKENILSEYSIKQIHSLILKNIDDENKGKYRTTNVIISGAEHKPPRNFEVQSQMQEFIKEYEEKRSKLHPIELASFVHIEFVKIHPFIDGNGRTSRLIMNYQLMDSGFLPVSIAKETRLDYYNTLEEYAVHGNLEKFLDLIATLEEKQLDDYIKLIKS